MAPHAEVAAVPQRQHGGILLVVLILCVTCSVVALSLLSTAEITWRSMTNATALDRAEQAALSAVEWGIASVKADGLSTRTRSARLAGEVDVTMEVRPHASPHILGTGRYQGAIVQWGADVRFLDAGRPYALACFGGDHKIDGEFVVEGHAWLGGNGQALPGSGRLQMHGHLDLASDAPVPNGRVLHVLGATHYGQTARTAPAWNTLPFATDAGWTVPVHRYSGSTTLKNKVLHGIVYVALAPGQDLKLDDVTIHGTLVVPWTHPPLADLLGRGTILLKDDVVIDGGTADTGNLAILAPGCRLKEDGIGSVDVTGITYALDVDGLENSRFTGMLLLRRGITLAREGVSVVRPAAFVPDLPVGLHLDYGDRVFVDWTGRR